MSDRLLFKHALRAVFSRMRQSLAAGQAELQPLLPSPGERRCATNFLSEGPPSRKSCAHAVPRMSTTPRTPGVAPSNPYQTKWTIARAIARKLGWSELFLIPARIVSSPVLIPLLPKRTFPFKGRQLPLFYHRYNITWANERMVELPIARHYLSAAGPDVLEIGNVTSHYQTITHPVLDKFEKAPGVINEDILAYETSRRFDLILSISTFEHIGFDDDDKDPSGARIAGAIERTRRFLKPGGRLVVTAAPGYNPAFERNFADGRLRPDALVCLKRRQRFTWEECSIVEAARTPYHRPFPFGNAVVVAEFGAPSA
jgi:hypothetical protein